MLLLHSMYGLTKSVSGNLLEFFEVNKLIKIIIILAIPLTTILLSTLIPVVVLGIAGFLYYYYRYKYLRKGHSEEVIGLNVVDPN